MGVRYMRYLFLSSILLISLSGCFSDCGYRQQTDYVESLSQEKLSLLYKEVALLSLNTGEFGETLRSTDIGESSSELSKMAFSLIRLQKERANLMLGGCFDDKAYLHFKGFNQNDKSITLTSGEHSYYREVVLWKKSK